MTLLTLNDQLNKAVTDQLTTVSKQRLLNQLGRLSREDMSQIERAIRVQLGLPA